MQQCFVQFDRTLKFSPILNFMTLKSKVHHPKGLLHVFHVLNSATAEKAIAATYPAGRVWTAL